MRPTCTGDLIARYAAWDAAATTRAGSPLNLSSTLELGFASNRSYLAMLEPFLERLQIGLAEVVVGVVGGSVSVGAGLRNASHDAWPNVLHLALQRLRPQARVRVHNAARAATTAGFAALCFDSLFGAATATTMDLLIIEYSWNTDAAFEMNALLQTALQRHIAVLVVDYQHLTRW